MNPLQSLKYILPNIDDDDAINIDHCRNYSFLAKNIIGDFKRRINGELSMPTESERSC